MPYLFSRGSSFCFSGSETPHSFCITMKIPFLFLVAAVVSVSSVADSVFEIQDETEDALSLLQVTANKHDLNDDRPRNNLCKTGIRKNRFCCGSQCRTCGGRGCQNRPGGQSSCCLASIKASGRKCNGRNMQNCMMPRRNRRRGRGQNQGNPGEEPEIPPTDISEPAVVEELSLCERSLKFNNVLRKAFFSEEFFQGKICLFHPRLLTPLTC